MIKLILTIEEYENILEWIEEQSALGMRNIADLIRELIEAGHVENEDD